MKWMPRCGIVRRSRWDQRRRAAVALAAVAGDWRVAGERRRAGATRGERGRRWEARGRGENARWEPGEGGYRVGRGSGGRGGVGVGVDGVHACTCPRAHYVAATWRPRRTGRARWRRRGATRAPAWGNTWTAQIGQSSRSGGHGQARHGKGPGWLAGQPEAAAATHGRTATTGGDTGNMMRRGGGHGWRWRGKK